LKQDLEENVADDIQSLNNLRKHFLQNLPSRKKHNSFNEEETEEDTGFLVQKHKISFLEKKLDGLAKDHKRLVGLFFLDYHLSPYIL